PVRHPPAQPRRGSPRNGTTDEIRHPRLQPREPRASGRRSPPLAVRHPLPDEREPLPPIGRQIPIHHIGHFAPLGDGPDDQALTQPRHRASALRAWRGATSPCPPCPPRRSSS